MLCWGQLTRRVSTDNMRTQDLEGVVVPANRTIRQLSLLCPTVTMITQKQLAGKGLTGLMKLETDRAVLS